MAARATTDGDGAGPTEKRVELVVITGYSGAGKSEAISVSLLTRSGVIRSLILNHT